MKAAIVVLSDPQSGSEESLGRSEIDVEVVRTPEQVVCRSLDECEEQDRRDDALSPARAQHRADLLPSHCYDLKQAARDPSRGFRLAR